MKNGPSLEDCEGKTQNWSNGFSSELGVSFPRTLRGWAQGLPPGEHLCPQQRGRAPSLSCWLSPCSPVPRFPGAPKEGEPHLRSPSLLSLGRKRGRYCIQGAPSSQTGLRGQLLEKGKGGFSRAEGGESPAVTKERDVLPLHVER